MIRIGHDFSHSLTYELDLGSSFNSGMNMVQITWTSHDETTTEYNESSFHNFGRSVKMEIGIDIYSMQIKVYNSNQYKHFNIVRSKLTLLYLVEKLLKTK